MPITRRGTRTGSDVTTNPQETRRTVGLQVDSGGVTSEVRTSAGTMCSGLEMPKTMVIPRPYTSGSWSEYLEYFNNVSDINNWSDLVKAKHLAISLSGVSATVYRSLRPEVKDNYQFLVDELTRMLQPPECAESIKLAFKSCKQKEDEDLTKYFASLKCLGREAFPLMPEDYFDELLKDRFIEGLRGTVVKFHVQLARPKSSADSFGIALTVQSTLKMHSNDYSSCDNGPIKDPVNVTSNVITRLECLGNKLERCGVTRDHPRQIPRCWSCGTLGHLRRQCRRCENGPLN